jgi:hypothetical protein
MERVLLVVVFVVVVVVDILAVEGVEKERMMQNGP